MGQALYASRQYTVTEICEQLRCSPATFYRRVLPTIAVPNLHAPE